MLKIKLSNGIPRPFQIIQGGQFQLVVDIRDQNDEPFDLTGLTELTTVFQNADGTETELKYSLSQIALVGAASRGQISINGSAAQSALFSPADVGTLELAITIGSADPIKVQEQGLYQVLA